MSTTPQSGPEPTGTEAPGARPTEPESADAPGTRPGEPGSGQRPAPAASARPKRRPAASLIFDDPLDRQSSDDTDRGWGERPRGGDGTADLARFLDEKPPHHL
ncbi:hypothetical protein ACFP1Z_17905 [Streptomyces gamaensis]|uniref:Uncharacterized protein n=1 Tax=Streptomyces gamaensis TaxID=1763542 RepID=A0ABW0Z4N6_9ACTN